jgi:thiol:disulfide interchange protein
MFQADITNDSDGTDALVRRYDVRGVPTVLIFDSSGNEVQRLVGYVGPQELIRAMSDVY